jgi:CRP-like cAMP-binding protein
MYHRFQSLPRLGILQSRETDRVTSQNKAAHRISVCAVTQARLPKLSRRAFRTLVQQVVSTWNPGLLLAVLFRQLNVNHKLRATYQI